MKAFLLAAGRGERLRPLTDSTPKCLVPICGEPLLAIWLRLCARHGITDVLVNTHHLAAQVDDFLASCRDGPRISRAHEETLLGSAGTVLANRAFVEGEADFFVIYADNLTNMDLGALLDFHRARSSMLTLSVVPTARPWEKGIVELDHDGRVVDFVEKPAAPRSNLSNGGVYVARRDLVSHLESLGGRASTLDFGFDVFPTLVGRMYGYEVSELLVDVGTPEAYRRVQQRWADAEGGRLGPGRNP